MKFGLTLTNGLDTDQVTPVLGITPTSNLRILGFLSLDGSPQALPVMVDATVTATQVQLGLTQGGSDTLRYSQGQRAQGQQGRGLRGRRMRCLRCY